MLLPLFAVGASSRAWVDADDAQGPVRVRTMSDFGCVQWEAR
jgi:hypothetical protein